MPHASGSSLSEISPNPKSAPRRALRGRTAAGWFRPARRVRASPATSAGSRRNMCRPRRAIRRCRRTEHAATPEKRQPVTATRIQVSRDTRCVTSTGRLGRANGFPASPAGNAFETSAAAQVTGLSLVETSPGDRRPFPLDVRPSLCGPFRAALGAARSLRATSRNTGAGLANLRRLSHSRRFVLLRN